MTVVPSPTTFPMCPTAVAVTLQALAAGAAWRCPRCGQQWDAGRLATVAAYDEYVAANDHLRAP